MFGHALVGVFGYGHMVGGYWGGQAEYVRVPFADLNCLPIPDDVPDEKALYLSDVIRKFISFTPVKRRSVIIVSWNAYFITF